MQMTGSCVQHDLLLELASGGVLASFQKPAVSLLFSDFAFKKQLDQGDDLAPPKTM